MEPWQVKLAEGDTEAAWDLFVGRYRRLIMATIRRIVEAEEIFDAFGHVCHVLSASGLERLCRYQGEVPRRPGSPRQARFSTWLVTVVHNLVVDWLRQSHGRRRVTAPAGLSPVQHEIFTRVFVEQRSHAEAYELVRVRTGHHATYTSFMKELAETYRVVERARPRGVMHYFDAAPLPESAEPAAETRVATAEIGARLEPALETLGVDDRVALRLFVIEGMAAADVARTLGWPNAKAVYNRVYRALKSLRAVLQREGIDRADL